MKLRNKFFSALAVVVSLGLLGVSSALAQTVTFNVFTAPTFVANTGRSEVVGQVTMSADATCGTAADGFCVSTAGTIQVLYVGMPIDNGTATGITVCDSTTLGTCNAAGGYLTGVITVTNTTAGGVVSFGVNGALDFAAGRQISVFGVRGQIDQSPGSVVGTSIISQLTASPSTIAAYVPTSEVVARSADPLTVTTVPGTLLQCRPVGRATIRITEGFNIAFVDHHTVPAGVSVDPFDGTAVTANPRPLFGGTNNSRINIVLAGLPSGVTIAWPAASAVDSGTGATGAFLALIPGSVSATTNTATYVFSTPDQALSDVNAEVFNINLDGPTLPFDLTAEIALSGTTADFGTASAQGQMHPAVTPTAGRPRYNHPLEPSPGATLLTVGPCTSNLLFPWVANVAGYDSGLALSNTSADIYATIPQTGTGSVNLFPTDPSTTNGVALPGPITITTAAVAPGSVWRNTMSNIPAFAGTAGYIIARCNFQYGHGFAFIADGFGGVPGIAHGYVALVIPDPTLFTGPPAFAAVGRSAAPGALDRLLQVAPGVVISPPTGESLGQ